MVKQSNLKFYLLLLLSLALLIRGFGLNLSLYDDEVWNPVEASIVEKGGYPDFFLHPPLFVGLNFLNSKTGLPLRTMSLFFGMLTLILTYFIAKEMYEEETAMLSVIIMAFSFYHILASLQLEMQGGIVTFFMLLTFYYFIKYRKSANLIMLGISGVFLGICLLTYYSTILILPILILFVFAHPINSRREESLSILYLFLIGGAVFALFPISTYLLNKPEIFNRTIVWLVGATPVSSRTSKDFGTLIEFFLSIVKHMYRLFLFGTPFLILTPVYAWVKRRNIYDDLMFFWIVVTFIAFTFLVPGGNISRYFMTIIPPLCILSARGVSELKRKDVKIGIFVLIISSAMVYVFNSRNFTKVPLTFSNLSINLLMKNPDIWLVSFSGPFFKISALSFLIVSFFSLIVMAGSFKLKDGSKILMILLALSLPMNILMITELFSYNFGPNYNNVISEMSQYYEENNLPKPIMGRHETFRFINNDSYAQFNEGLENFFNTGGTVMWLNLPPVFDGGPYNKKLNYMRSNCDLKKIFYSKSYESGYIFVCDASN